MNNKGQFFIVAAVIIVLSITLIFSYLSQAGTADISHLSSVDASYISNDIVSEYRETAENVLANVSKNTSLTSSEINDSLVNNLDDFKALAGNITADRGLFLNTTISPNGVQYNYSTAISGYVILQMPNNRIATTVNIWRSIYVNITKVTNENPECNFTFIVQKEYNEPMYDLTAGSLNTVSINGTQYSDCTLNVTGNPPDYNVSCPRTCITASLMVNITDSRGVIGRGINGSAAPSPPLEDAIIT